MGVNAELAGVKVRIRPTLCETCGLVYLDPPTDEALLADYYSAQTRLLSDTAAYNEQAEMIAKHVTGGRILDIGAYDGRLLSKLNGVLKKDIFPHGIEPDTSVNPIFEYTRWSYLDDVFILGMTFDLITLGHTLEHLADPVKTLEQCRELLKSGGKLFVEVPNLLEPQVQLVPYWTAQHLFYYSPRTLRAMLAKCGFEVVEQSNTEYGATRVIARLNGSPTLIENAVRAQDILDSAKKYEQDYIEELRRVAAILDPCSGKIAIFGAGEHTYWLLQQVQFMHLSGFSHQVECVIDSHPEKQGSMVKVGGKKVPVISPEDVPEDIKHVIISSYDTQNEMAEVFPGRAVKLYNEIKAYDVWKNSHNE